MKYRVRLEFNVVSTDFADINVEADTPEEARVVAAKTYLDAEGSLDLDYYAGDEIDTSLDTGYQLDWLVEEIL